MLARGKGLLGGGLGILDDDFDLPIGEEFLGFTLEGLVGVVNPGKVQDVALDGDGDFWFRVVRHGHGSFSVYAM